MWSHFWQIILFDVFWNTITPKTVKKLTKKSVKKSVKKSFKKSVKKSIKNLLKICQKICQKIFEKNLSKDLSKNWQKNLSKNTYIKKSVQIYEFSIFFSDYPFLIHRLPQNGNLPQVKKHCDLANPPLLPLIVNVVHGWLIRSWFRTCC